MFKFIKRLFIPENEHWGVDFDFETGLNIWTKYRWGEPQYTIKWPDLNYIEDKMRYSNVNNR